MEKSNILLVGVGQAGANIVSDILNKDRRYVGLFINTSYKDIMPLNNAKNIYVIPNADGTGRNRTKAKMYAKEYFTSIIDSINKFPMQNILYFCFSLSGGTGSGLTPVIIKMLKAMGSNKNINVIGVLPALDDSKRAKQNAIECWNELIKLDNINSMFILDNDKRNDKMDINREFAERFDCLMDISKPHKSGNIDTSDAEVLSTAKGSSAIYILPEDEKDTKVAIAKAIQDSIFADYDEDICNYLGISLLENSNLNRKTIIDTFHVQEDIFKDGYNNKCNLVIASGYDLILQKDAIDFLESNVNEQNNNNQITPTSIDDLIVGKKIKKNNIIIDKKNIHSDNIKQQDKDIEKILDDNFWEDIF